MKKKASSRKKGTGARELPEEPPALIPEAETENKIEKMSPKSHTRKQGKTQASSGQAKHNPTYSEDQLKKLALAVLSKANLLNTVKYDPQEWNQFPGRFISTVMHVEVTRPLLLRSKPPAFFYTFYYNPTTRVIGEKTSDGMIEMTLQKRSNSTYFVAHHLEKQMLRSEFSVFEQEDVFLYAKQPTFSHAGVLEVFAQHVCSKVNTTSESVIDQLKKLMDEEDRSDSSSLYATADKIIACAKEMKDLRKMETMIDKITFLSPQAYILSSKMSRTLGRRTSEVGDCLAADEPLYQVDLKLTTERAEHLKAKASLKKEEYGNANYGKGDDLDYDAPRTKAQQAADAIRKKDERQDNLIQRGTKATLAAEKEAHNTTLRKIEDAKKMGRYLRSKYS